METGIGATLRDARNRRKVDLPEVEATTKIRLRYLRAMENEEWDVLPGGPYTRSFIRTYASYLGLDGERLADEYRRETGEPPPGERLQRAEPVVVSGPPRRGPRLSRGAWVASVAIALVGLLVVIGLSGGDGDGSSGTGAPGERGEEQRQRRALQAQESEPGVSVRLAADAEVWVCLLDADGQALVNGQILAAGAEEGPFRSDSFTVSFGNGEVAMEIDGQQASIPETSSPVGYEIDSSGRLRSLSELERPTCT